MGRNARRRAESKAATKPVMRPTPPNPEKRVAQTKARLRRDLAGLQTRADFLQMVAQSPHPAATKKFLEPLLPSHLRGKDPDIDDDDDDETTLTARANDEAAE